MRTRVVEYNDAKITQVEVGCISCGIERWVRVGDAHRKKCRACHLEEYKNNHSFNDGDAMPQDEKENRRMIDEFLKNNKPSVVKHPAMLHQEPKMFGMYEV